MGLVVIAAVDLLAVAALHRLGPAPPPSEFATWLSSAPVEDVLFLVLRGVGLALAYWIALSLVVTLLASIRRWPRFGTVAGRLVVPFLRPLLDRTLVLALATTPVMSAAPAWASPPPVLQPTEILPPYVPIPAGLDEEVEGEDADTPPLMPLLPPLRSGPSPSTYTVVKGDNLWRIACAQLRGNGEKPTSGEIVPYWLELIELNREGLRSGDPDLIYPGEELLLP